MVQQRKSSHREVLPNNTCSIVADCLSKVIDRKLPEERQTSLIASIFDMLQVPTVEERRLARYIKHNVNGPEGQVSLTLKQTLATTTGDKKCSPLVAEAMRKCDSLGSGMQLILHGNTSDTATYVLPSEQYDRRT